MRYAGFGGRRAERVADSSQLVWGRLRRPFCSPRCSFSSHSSAAAITPRVGVCRQLLCAWIVAVVALLGTRERLRRLELVQLAGLSLLGVLALVIGRLGGRRPRLGAAGDPVAGALCSDGRRDAHALSARNAARRNGLGVSGGGRPCSRSERASSPALEVPTRRETTACTSRSATGTASASGLRWAWRSGSSLPAVLARWRCERQPRPSCVPCAATLYFTFSRGAWVALAVGLLVAFAVDPRTTRTRSLGRPGLAVAGRRHSAGFAFAWAHDRYACAGAGTSRRQVPRSCPRRPVHRRGSHRVGTGAGGAAASPDPRMPAVPSPPCWSQSVRSPELESS